MTHLEATAGWMPRQDEQGTMATVEALFRLHRESVFAAAYRVTGDAMAAEDVLQSVFVRLIRSSAWPADGDPALLGSYLRRAAVNGALDALRAQSRRPRQVDDVAEAAAAVLGPESSADETLGRLRLALAGLSPKAAEMIVLRYIEGFSNVEIGHLFGTSASVVAVTLHRARAQLRAALAP